MFYNNIIITTIIAFTYIFPQQLIWKHTGGPMGGMVGDIAINSKGEIFAGVYTYVIGYAGLYKSTDNGNTWNKINTTPFEDFEVYAIYITKEDHIWVGTHYQGKIYRSTDNGITWENKNNGYNTGECWAFGKSKNNVLFAGDGKFANLFRSTDYGNNWVFSKRITPLVFATDSNNIVFCGTLDGLFTSTDDGLTWRRVDYFNNIPVSTILIDPNNYVYCGTGYYNNGDGVFYSTNGGQDWNHLGLTGKIVLSLSFDSEKNLYAGTARDGLFKTTNMGQTWLNYNNGLYRKDVFRLKLNKNDDIFIGSEIGGVFRSTDFGISFQHIGLPIQRINNMVVFGDSLIFLATEPGVQQFNIKTGKWSNLGLIKVEAISITPSNYLYVATSDEGLFKSTDLGKTWQLTNLTRASVGRSYNVLSVSDDTFFVSTEFKLIRSTDGGNTWSNTNISTSFLSRSMFFKSGFLFVTGSTGSIFRSTNMGNSFDIVFSYSANWYDNNKISALSNGFVYCADTHSYNGVIRSTNWGTNWTQTLYNIPITNVFAEEDGKVFAAGVDSVYFSSNFGSSWIGLSQPFNLSYVSDIKKINNNKYYFGTYNKGLYEVDFPTNVEDYQFDIPKEFILNQNYPNPFNPTTKISWYSPVGAHTKLNVYDLLGREVVTLVNEFRKAGKHEIEFPNAETSFLSSLPSGVYFYQLRVGDFVETKKMVYLR